MTRPSPRDDPVTQAIFPVNDLLEFMRDFLSGYACCPTTGLPKGLCGREYAVLRGRRRSLSLPQRDYLLPAVADKPTF